MINYMPPLYELEAMREKGYTNQQIADHFDISYKSVLRKLGKQEETMRKRPERTKNTKSVKIAAVQTVEKESYNLRIKEHIIELEGECASYSIDARENIVDINSGDKSLIISIDTLDQFIKELLEVVRRMPKIELKNE